ncbi:MAG: hypothetical protein PHN84_13150 [Desulfuromonadaceae bacterium]|nr:hypothetical protein [Desulfuromonadaceae bacterium]MDD2854366.1 hypothetical protein [Desulfuromonadaceae bacterium]
MNGSARSQVTVNLVFMLLKSVFILLSFRLADVMLSANLMGLVLLFRRQGGMWSNLVQLGFSQVLLKYYVSSDSADYRANLLHRLVRWTAVAVLVTVSVCTVFAVPLNDWLFPSAHPAVTVAFGVYVSGLAIGFIANSSWLAEFKFVQSNLIDWFNGSLLFVICLLFSNRLDLVSFSWLLALMTVVASVFSLMLFARHFGCHLYQPGGGWSLALQERRYGFTRALTAYADMATMVIGPWLLRSKPAEAAQLIAAYTVLRIAQTLVMPVAQVLALRANSKRYNSGREERRILILCAFVFACAWIGVAAYYLLGAWAVHWWMPNSAAGVVAVLDVLMPFMPGICLFYSLRNHVDLQFMTPWNLITLVLSIVLFFVATLAHKQIDADVMVVASSYMFAVYYAYDFLFIYKTITNLVVNANVRNI